jgi:argininosuccinate synthase
VARSSPHSLYNEEAVSFDTASEQYDPTKARGFIDTQAFEQQAQMRQKRTLRSQEQRTSTEERS